MFYMNVSLTFNVPEQCRLFQRFEEIQKQALRKDTNLCTINRERGSKWLDRHEQYTGTNVQHNNLTSHLCDWGEGWKHKRAEREMMTRCRLCCPAHRHTLTRADKQQHRWRHHYWDWAAERGGLDLIHSQLLHTQMHSKRMGKSKKQNSIVGFWPQIFAKPCIEHREANIHTHYSIWR